MQYRPEKRVNKWHNMEPVLMEQRGEHILPRSAVSVPCSSLVQTQTAFLESVGVGFSYADYGEKIETTEDAANNVYAFISIFSETFPQFAGRPLHLSGESYAVSLIFSSPASWLT